MGIGFCCLNYLRGGRELVAEAYRRFIAFLIISQETGRRGHRAHASSASA